MSSDAKWYVVHTFSGYENKVASNILTVVENRNLHDLILDVRVPTEKVTEIKDNKTREVEHKIYPGYVLIKMVMTDDSWYVVRNTRGCTGFVGPESKPVALTPDEVRRLGIDEVALEEDYDVDEFINISEEIRAAGNTVLLDYKVGDVVNVVGGALDGFSGTVESIDTQNNCVQVTIMMLGRETSVEFELNQLELAGKSKQ